MFFSQYEDYSSHDADYIEFQDSPTLFKTFMNARGHGKDIFFYKTMSKDEFIKYELEHCKKTPMAVGKFLAPDVIKYFKLTIDELKQFQFAFDNIDERHTYEKFIYDCYIENNDFILTKEQLDNAYEIYKLKKNKK